MKNGMFLRRIYTDLIIHAINDLRNCGYTEATIGVELMNREAWLMYRRIGFTEDIGTCWEEYQGDKFSFELLLKPLA